MEKGQISISVEFSYEELKFRFLTQSFCIKLFIRIFIIIRLEIKILKKPLTILIVCLYLTISFSCENDEENKNLNDEKQGMTIPNLEEYQNGGMPMEKLEEIKIPDSINTSLVIAMYDEHLPQEGRTIIVYDDSSRTSVTKISYLIDSSIKKEPLLKIREDEFKSKFTSENYIITMNNVYWGYSNNSGVNTSYEYLRLDNFKK